MFVCTCATFDGVTSMQLPVNRQVNRYILLCFDSSTLLHSPWKKKEPHCFTEGGKCHYAEPKRKSRDVRQALSSSDYVTRHNENTQVPVKYISVYIYINILLLYLHKALQFILGCYSLYLLLANLSHDIFVHKKWLMESTGVNIDEKYARIFVWKCLEGRSEGCGSTRPAELVSRVS